MDDSVKQALKKAKDNESGSVNKGDRVAKIIAHAGLGSRRDVEGWILEGRVQVNGKTLDTPACLVTEDDSIKVDGKLIPRKSPTRFFCYHKPPNLVTTHKDELGRETVFDRLPKNLPRLISVGRLDLNSEGLLLLTTDGELSRYLELPATGWTRRYRVRVFGELDEKKLKDLEKGTTVEGIEYGPIQVKIESKKGINSWLIVSLKEGKNREIRRVMESLGLQVNRLIRQSYGPFQLGSLVRGNIKEIHTANLKEQIPGFFKK